ncbi:cell wall protein DAN4, partial [Biomphalaria pfeifferi]
MDSSGSIGAANYKQMLEFAVSITERFTLGTEDVQFAQVIFGANAYKKFDFNTHKTFASLKKAILATPYLKQSTRTDRALTFVLNSTIFKESSGARPKARKIILLMTDGVSDLPRQTLQAAQQVKDSNIDIIAVGIANALEEELRHMASSSQDVFMCKSFDDLKYITDKVTDRACI